MDSTVQQASVTSLGAWALVPWEEEPTFVAVPDDGRAAVQLRRLQHYDLSGWMVPLDSAALWPHTFDWDTSRFRLYVEKTADEHQRASQILGLLGFALDGLERVFSLTRPPPP